jgi:sec-independent protein translocase protein TatC
MLLYLKDLLKRIRNWFLFWILISILIFSFPFSNPISKAFFQHLKEKFVPKGVELVVLSPTTAFLTQIELSLFLGFVLTLPYLLLKIFDFILPALTPPEKKILFFFFPLLLILFFLGFFFGYFFLIPFTFKLLYFFALSLRAFPFFEMGQFFILVLGLMVASGILFLTPIFMLFLTRLGLVPSEFWIKKWQIAFFVFILISAIITPDGSGVTQLILSFVLTGLYFLGYTLTKVFKGQK